MVKERERAKTKMVPHQELLKLSIVSSSVVCSYLNHSNKTLKIKSLPNPLFTERERERERERICDSVCASLPHAYSISKELPQRIFSFYQLLLLVTYSLHCIKSILSYPSFFFLFSFFFLIFGTHTYSFVSLLGYFPT